MKWARSHCNAATSLTDHCGSTQPDRPNLRSGEHGPFPNLEEIFNVRGARPIVTMASWRCRWWNDLMRFSKLAAVAFAGLILAACVNKQKMTQGADLILPGFLDLSLLSGQTLLNQSTAYPYRLASIQDGARAGIEPYLKILRARGWVEQELEPWEGEAKVLRHGAGAGAECVLATQGLTFTADGPPGSVPYYSIQFQQWPCRSDRFIFPNSVDLPIVPGNWLDEQSESFARIITTEGSRKRMFDVYVEELEKKAWTTVISGTDAVVMRRGADGPCLGVMHYQSSRSRLNLIEFNLAPDAAMCSLLRRGEG